MKREPNTHELKSWPTSFRAAVTGRKRFEVRKDDRSPRFAAGDVVKLREWDPDPAVDDERMLPRGYTGRVALFFVGYIERSVCLPAGWCAFDLVSPEDVNRVDLAISGVE